ncbi:hypothetical protein WICPIJ_009178 [Wickerhamomyces pijperi]|uniref:Uncharacterized protein n=1 Tax=Wickerhamomyces pijperi TaxID=599730 RepID=A0A9P8TE59_WICPI|nr:hypothetical protein WICPIJ_009178 [Wickerhamomyces pijperi]
MDITLKVYRIGQGLPRKTPFNVPLPLTIKYKELQAVMNPEPESTSPSYIIHEPRAKAEPNNKDDNGEGPICLTLAADERKEPPPPTEPCGAARVFSGPPLIIGVAKTKADCNKDGYGVEEYW